MSMFCYKKNPPEMTLCGWRDYKPSTNKQTNGIYESSSSFRSPVTTLVETSSGLCNLCRDHRLCTSYAVTESLAGLRLWAAYRRVKSTSLPRSLYTPVIFAINDHYIIVMILSVLQWYAFDSRTVLRAYYIASKGHQNT